MRSSEQEIFMAAVEKDIVLTLFIENMCTRIAQTVYEF